MTPQAATPLHVLIVEDDPDLGEVICDFLREEGYEAHLTSTLAEALALAEQQTFHLALTDLLSHSHVAPLDSVKPLMQRLSPVPVGIVTGWPLTNELVIEQGFAFLLRKPFDVTDLLAAVAAHLQRMAIPEQAQRTDPPPHGAQQPLSQ